MRTYFIQLRGPVDVEELNPLSPYQMTSILVGRNSTFVSIYTDQSGLIGLLRHLHNLGFVVHSIVSGDEDTTQKIERKEQ